MSKLDETVSIQPIVSFFVRVTDSRQLSSYKIINWDKQEMSLGKQHVRGSCPKGKLEFKFFSEPWTCQGVNSQHNSNILLQ